MIKVDDVRVLTCTICEFSRRLHPQEIAPLVCPACRNGGSVVYKQEVLHTEADRILKAVGIRRVG